MKSNGKINRKLSVCENPAEPLVVDPSDTKKRKSNLCAIIFGGVLFSILWKKNVKSFL